MLRIADGNQTPSEYSMPRYSCLLGRTLVVGGVSSAFPEDVLSFRSGPLSFPSEESLSLPHL